MLNLVVLYYVWVYGIICTYYIWVYGIICMYYIWVYGIICMYYVWVYGIICMYYIWVYGIICMYYVWVYRIPSHKLDQVDCSMPGMDMPHPPQVPHPQWVEETTDVMERLTRISLTFRKVQQSPNCSCGHHLCDKRDQLTSPHGPLV